MPPLETRTDSPGKTPEEPQDPRLPGSSPCESREFEGWTVLAWKDLWESLTVKPLAKAIDPMIHAYGSVTLLLQLGRKAHVHAPTRDED